MIICVPLFLEAYFSSPAGVPDKKPPSFIKDGKRAWLNLVLLGTSFLVVGGFLNSLGALITPLTLEFGVDVSTASLPVNLVAAVFSLAALPVNVILEKNYMGPK